MISTDSDSSEQLRHELTRQANQSHGTAPAAYFYRSPQVYQIELSQLLFKSWIYAGHISQLPEAGCYLTVELGDDSILVVRDRDGGLRALANTCRHRGARVCEPGTGSTRTFVCPYHAWTYNLDGSLRSARHMDALDGFDPDQYPLKSLSVCEFEGLIFVNGDPEAADFNAPLSKLRNQLGAYDLAGAKIAHRETYRIGANWKLCLENYLECYHCGPAHRAYARMHTLQDSYENVGHQVEAMLAKSAETTGVPGIADEVRATYGAATGFGTCVSHMRYGLYAGYVTGSESGEPLAPLMGQVQGFDGGAGDFQMGPVSFMLCYPDHCVLYRFLPRGLDATDAEVVWFVGRDAVEGKDYDRNRLTWLWHHTTLEDKFIIGRNRDGVMSHFFEPGPFQPEFEETLVDFYVWYFSILNKAAEAR